MNLQTLESAFTWTWHSSWRACVLIVVVLIVQALAGRRMPARFRYALGLLVLLRLLLPYTPASSWSVFNLSPHIRTAPVATPIVSSTVRALVKVAPLSVQSPIVVSRPSRVSLGQWAALFWACGGAGLLSAVFWRHRRFSCWVAKLPTTTR